MFEHLFTPIKIGPMELKNRIGLPPMTVGYGQPSGEVTDRHYAYYGTRARGGASLIMTESTAVNEGVL